jgi:rhamnogalacturonyl hydrolase YesR
MVSPAGQILRHCDRVEVTMHGPNLIQLFGMTKDTRYRLAADHMASYLITRSAGEGGTVAYTGHLCLVDTLGMICPFLAEYDSPIDAVEAGLFDHARNFS